jgi:hypothetical protein
VHLLDIAFGFGSRGGFVRTSNKIFPKGFISFLLSTGGFRRVLAPATPPAQ